MFLMKMKMMKFWFVKRIFCITLFFILTIFYKYLKNKKIKHDIDLLKVESSDRLSVLEDLNMYLDECLIFTIINK